MSSSYKLVLLGAGNVGKSSIVLRFVKNVFDEFQEPTIGATFLTQTIKLDDDIIQFEIWDTAGQEIYRSLAPMYYRGSAAAIIVYDITSESTFKTAQSWVEELKRVGPTDVILALAGNKVDEDGENRAVSREEAAAYADKENLIFAETSAKTGHGIEELFVALGKKASQLPTNKQAEYELDLDITNLESTSSDSGSGSTSTSSENEKSGCKCG